MFGGVQAFTIIISIIRSKFVAVLLALIEACGLLTSTTGFVSALTNFGSGPAHSAAVATGDETRVSQVSIVLRRLVWITGLIGMVLTAVLVSLAE